MADKPKVGLTASPSFSLKSQRWLLAAGLPIDLTLIQVTPADAMVFVVWGGGRYCQGGGKRRRVVAQVKP